MDEIVFDDFEALRRQVSEEFDPWGPELLVDQGFIDRFAELSGDHQWIHVDTERARRESPLGTTMAHGLLTLSLLPRLLGTPTWRVTGHGSATNYGLDRVRFLNPVPAGSRIHMRQRLAEVAEHRAGTLLTWAHEVAVVGALRPALACRIRLLYLP